MCVYDVCVCVCGGGGGMLPGKGCSSAEVTAMSLIPRGVGERELRRMVPTARVCCCEITERLAGMVNSMLEPCVLMKRVPDA